MSRPMRRALLLVGLLLLAGCTSQPAPTDRDQPAYAWSSTRVDLDGDGRYDHVNLTLVASQQPVASQDVEVRMDGSPVDPVKGLGGDPWRPGQGLLFACPEGVHEYQVFIGGELRKLVVHECGVEVPVAPPSFEGRLVDGDADGRKDAVQLSLVGGGPIDPRSLTVTVGDHEVRVYATALKSRVAREPLGNGSRVYTPCWPGADRVNVTWRETALPGLQLSGCQAHIPGVDAPLVVDQLDVDDDGVQDGWRLTLAAPNDGGFVLANLNATWDQARTQLNGSVALAPPPEMWRTGESLVALCPGDGSHAFVLAIGPTPIFQGLTTCETPPGQPLLELDLEDDGGRLEAALSLSRVDPLNASRLTTADGEAVGQGTWEVGETKVMGCPGGNLTLTYEGRLAFRGPAPC